MGLSQLLDDVKQRGVTAVLPAESGCALANPPEQIAHLRPSLALISVAAGDWQGLPSPKTLEALEGRTVLRTDRNGWVELGFTPFSGQIVKGNSDGRPRIGSVTDSPRSSAF